MYRADHHKKKKRSSTNQNTSERSKDSAKSMEIQN